MKLKHIILLALTILFCCLTFAHLNMNNVMKVGLLRFTSAAASLGFLENKTLSATVADRFILRASVWEAYPEFAYFMVTLLSVSVLVIVCLCALLFYRHRRHKEKQTKQLIFKENLKEKKKSLEDIIATTPIFYMLAIDGKVVQLNESMKKNTGLEVGDKIQPIYADLEHRNILMERVLSKNIIQNEIINIKFADGKTHRTLVNAAALEYDRKAATVIWAIDVEEHEAIKDRLISSQSETQKMKERLEWIVQTSSVGYMLVSNQKILEINDNMRISLGLKEGDLITEFYPKISDHNSCINRFKKGEEVNSESITVTYANGEEHRCLVSLTSLKNYNYKAVAIWMVDIEQSERRKDNLDAAHKSLQTVLDSLPAAVRITDVESGAIVYANDACRNMFGYDSFESMSLSSLVPELQGDGMPSRDKISLLLHSETPLTMDLDYIAADGRTLYCRTSVCKIEYNERKASLAFIASLDKEKESEKLRQSLQRVLDMLPVPVRIVDNKTKILTYANRAAGEMFGIENIEYYFGKSSYIFIPDSQTSGSTSEEIISNIVVSSKPTVTEIELHNHKEQRIHTLITSCLIDYNGVESSVAIIQDLTKEKDYQAMLMNTANREKEANQLKSRFLVNMSHEIRTPMNVIIGLTQIELNKDTGDGARDIYQKINVSAKNLLAIINDVLDLSKIEANKIELYEDEIELEEVLNSALLVASPRLENKNIEFLLNVSLDLPRYIIGDRTRLWQILKNFLDNSAKYTEKGKIVLTVYTDNEQSNDDNVTIVFVIEDTGIGMSEEQMQKIYEPYEQFCNNAQKKYDGTGLGMVISKQLCDLMGGTLNIASEKNVGTIIHLSIPFKRSADKETNLTLAKSKVLNGINILAVDDDQLSLNIMKSLLQNSGATCITAHSGDEALKIILEKRNRNESLDLILLDYMMEGMNGLETAKQIQVSLSKAPKLLMVTAYQKLLLKSELERSGIGDIVEKPFIPSHFLHKVCTAIGLETEKIHSASERYQRFVDANVLLCEDYTLNQEVAAGMLAQFGVTATIAANGQEGLEMLNNGKVYDLILMDLNMPVMDGYEAAQIIRQNSKYDKIPIIMFSADALKETADACIKIGMNDYLTKPIEFDKLYNILLKWLPEAKRDTSGVFEFETRFDNEALARFGNNHDRFEKALMEFGELLPDHWQDYSDIIDDNNKIKSFVHKLKGAAGTLGEKEIYDCALAFENSTNDEKHNRAFYARLIDVCDRAKKRIKSIGGNACAGAAQPGNSSEFTSLLGKLKNALSEYDPHASLAVIKTLKEKSWSFIDCALFDQLIELSEKYEFDAALSILDEIPETKE